MTIEKPSLLLTRPGISPEMLRQAGVRDVDAGEAHALVGYNSPGLVIPYRTIAGELVSIDGKLFHRLRLHKPTGSAKYLSPAGSGCQLYVPPGLVKQFEPSCGLGVVEGEFKAMSLVEAGFPCVAIGGFASACPRSASGEPELLPDLVELIAEYRPSRLLFIGDNDTALNADFSREAVKLAKLVGVPVELPRIPLDAPGKGPDDLREVWGAEFPAKWRAIVDEAELVTSKTKHGMLAVRLLRREREALGCLTANGRDHALDKLVKLAAAVHREPLAANEVEQIAVEFLRITRTVFRSAVEAHLEESRRVAAQAFGAKILSNGNNRSAQQMNGPARSGDTMLILPSGNLSITDAANDIFQVIARDRSQFFRGGRVHELDRGGFDAILSPLTDVQFRSRLENYGKVMAWRSDGLGGEFVLKPARCSKDTAGALLFSLPAQLHLPRVRALSPCPVLANLGEGCDVLGAGWHDFNGGIYVTGGETPPIVPFDRAVESLSGLMRDFDFLKDADRARAFAALITPALRMGGWLEQRAPVDIAEADASQAGKGFRQKLTAALYRQRPRLVTQKTGGVGGLDESLAQALVEGHGFVALDNIRGRINSPFFEAVLTAPGEVGCRIPYKGEVGVDPSLVNFQLSSNGAETTPDLANRSSVVRIRKRPESYTFSVYPEGTVFDHVQANQGYFLGCVFTLILHWAEAGQPRTDERRHDFRAWAGVLDWFTREALNAGPLLDGHNEAKARIGDAKLSWVRSICVAMRDAGVGVGSESLAASQLADFAIEAGLPPPNVQSDADAQAISKVIGGIMAQVFKEASTVEIDGFRLTRTERYSSTKGGNIFVYALAA